MVLFVSPNTYKTKEIALDSICLTTNCTDTFLRRTQTKPQETLDNNLTKSKASFSFDIPLQSDDGID